MPIWLNRLRQVVRARRPRCLSLSCRPVLEQLEERCLPAGGLQPAGSYAATTRPGAVAAGDFNGDGKLDLVVESGYYDSDVVLLGNGDGTFQPPRSFGFSVTARSVAVGDFNRDGKLDLVIAGGGDAVSVALGNGDGTFTFGSPSNFAAGVLPSAVAVGDFNGDGKLDLAVTDFATNISVLLGNGDGTFQAPRNFLPGGADPAAVAVGDFNGDGKLDLATANNLNLGDMGVSVLLGNGDGTFQKHRDFATGSMPAGIAVGDFDGDGTLDLAVSNFAGDSTTVSVLLGNGDGTFQAHRDYVTGLRPTAVAVGDFDGDGTLDLAVTSLGGGVSLLLGNGDGTFQAARNFPVGAAPSGLAVGDFNGDGLPDVAVANGGDNTVSILLGTSGAAMTASERFVIQVYRDLLQREVDPSGLASWSGLLDQGKATRFQVVQWIENSVEYRTLEVRQVYRDFFQREVDPSGLATWVQFLNFTQAGHGVDDLRAIILGSGEYFTRVVFFGTAQAFLTRVNLDLNLLGRPIDPTVLTGGSILLQAGASRTAVATEILHSLEAERGEVRLLYNRFLHRDPDPGGLDTFTQALQALVPEEQVISTLLGSDEYFSHV